MDVPANLVTVLHAAAERLSQYLHQLPPDAWTQPSACEQWEVRDVVGHLTVEGEQGLTEAFDRWLKGA